MTNRGYRLLALACIGAALLLIVVSGYTWAPPQTVVVPSGQAEGVGSGAISTPVAWPEWMTEPPFRVDRNGYLITTDAPTPTPTPRPKRTPRPTATVIPSCPPATPGYCEWPTPIPAPIYPTPIPTCSASPQPGTGCIWMGE